MAFWSGQDRQDQAASRLFSVLGKITSDRPEVLITAGSNRQEVKLKLDEAFDFENEKLHETSDYSVPEDAFEKITEYRYTAPAASTYAGGYNYGYDDDYYRGTPVGTGTANKSGSKKGSKHAVTPSYQTDSYKAKTKLLAAVNTYFSVYNLSQVHIQALFSAFIEFFEEETLSKNTSSATQPEFSALFAAIDTDVSASLAVLLETLFDEFEDDLPLQETSLTVVPDENEKNRGVDTLVATEFAEESTLSLPEPNKKLV